MEKYLGIIVLQLVFKVHLTLKHIMDVSSKVM